MHLIPPENSRKFQVELRMGGEIQLLVMARLSHEKLTTTTTTTSLQYY